MLGKESIIPSLYAFMRFFLSIVDDSARHFSFWYMTFLQQQADKRNLIGVFDNWAPVACACIWCHPIIYSYNNNVSPDPILHGAHVEMTDDSSQGLAILMCMYYPTRLLAIFQIHAAIKNTPITSAQHSFRVIKVI